MKHAKGEPERILKTVTAEFVVVCGVCPLPTCGAEFTPSRDDQIYCSEACRKAAHRMRERARG